MESRGFMDSTHFESLKNRLDDCVEWPTQYTFKFVVTSENLEDLKNLFPENNISLRSSRTAKYTSLTCTQVMKSSNEVIAVYQQVGKIDGVISL